MYGSVRMISERVPTKSEQDDVVVAGPPLPLGALSEGAVGEPVQPAALVVGGFALVAATCVARTRTHLATALAIASLVIAGIWHVPAWDRDLLSSGAYKYAPYFGPSPYRPALLRAGELLFYGEGAAATVAVRRVAGSMC